MKVKKKKDNLVIGRWGFILQVMKNYEKLSDLKISVKVNYSM